MKKFKTILIATVIAVALLGCTKEEMIPDKTDMSVSSETALKSTAKPAANLMGEFYIEFVLVPGIPGPTWDGTISFEGYEGEYGYRFYSLDARFPGQSFHFDEIYEIYDLISGEVLLSGHDKGISAPSLIMPEPEMFRILGKVEIANGPFEMWLGRHVNVKGTVYFQEIPTPDGPVIAPSHCYGELRVN